MYRVSQFTQNKQNHSITPVVYICGFICRCTFMQYNMHGQDAIAINAYFQISNLSLGPSSCYSHNNPPVKLEALYMHMQAKKKTKYMFTSGCCIFF